MRSGPRLALLSITSVLVFVAGLEGLLRGLAAQGWIELAPPPDIRAQWAEQGWSVDRDLHWALLPNHTGRLGGKRYKTNSHGLRDQEIPLDKPADTYRILVLGDSTVFGFGVRFRESFSELLEQRLNESLGKTHFDVINASVPGYSIFNVVAYLKRDGLRFEPDLIVVETSFNDRRFVPSTDLQDSAEIYARFYDQMRLREQLSRSFLYRGLRRLLVAGLRMPQGRFPEEGEYGYQDIDPANLHRRVEPDRYARILEDIADLASDGDIAVVLFPLPDSPRYTREFDVAYTLAERGETDLAIQVLQRIDRQNELYRIVVARTINEMLDAAGRSDERIASIPAPDGWMTTDGNVLVSLGRPYAEAMRRAAGRDGVWVLPFDPAEPGLPDLYLDYIHLNADGHRIAAEKLLELLTSRSGPDLPD